MINIIAAVSKNDVLGKENKLLWHLPKDFKFFKETTFGHPMIMGRKTFESLPGILPGRTHIVITRDQNFSKEGIKVASSVEEAIKIAKEEDEEIFIIGGGQIFKETLEKNLVDKIYLTQIDIEIEGDTFFPALDNTKWEISKKECHTKDDRNNFDFCFVEYLRK